MISGTIEAMNVKPFVTKTGSDMLKIGIKIDGQWYNTVSKFEPKYTKGTEVFFETQTDYIDSIVMGTLKISTGQTANKILADSHKPFTSDAVTAFEVKKLRKENEELKRKLKDLEDEAVLKELDSEFNDDIPF